ncbi:MAG TPA: hypothetical protein PKA58_04945 [Polyangium sp.]|nr:hypothetical protein [Polyangium sp.]
MLRRPSQLGLLLLSTLGAVTLGAACGGGTGASGTNGQTTSTSGTAGAGGDSGNGGGAGMGGDCGLFGCGGMGGSPQMQGFNVQPAAPQTIDVALGQSMPTITYTATLDGKPIGAGWSVDRGDLGTIPAGPADTASFAPKGTVGGVVHVRAGLNGQTLERQVFIKVSGTQNGADPGNPLQAPQIATTIPQLTQDGGVGGVGGEGLGSMVDPTLVTTLGMPGSNGQAEGLRFLYPYDKTVFPRGILAPLLMWESTLGDVDAIRIDLETTSGSFKWNGTFGKPPILQQTGGAFVRHPIPQNVWAAATNTAGAKAPDGTIDKLIVKLTVANGGLAYGPISETWSIAPGRLSGIIYYNSYGTKLAKNYTGAIGGDGRFGGAVLSIKVGDTGPKLAAGNDQECRVCHSVAANGSRLTTEGMVYDITPNSITGKSVPSVLGFPGLSPDGSTALNSAAQLVALANGTILPATGISNVSSNVGTPSFSPDGKRVVVNPMNSPIVPNALQKLVTLDFDPATNTFSNPVTILDLTGQPAETRPGWAAFFPDGKSVVYHHQIAAGVDGNNLGDLRTRKGAKSYIAIADATTPGTPTPLNQLNGKDAGGTVYLPKLAQPVNMACFGDGASVGGIDADHGDDANLNYEPTVNPIAAGGYAWVVFTSRRLYGSVAAIPPFCSDPRGVDLFQNITPKKLWVSAIDLNSPAGVDGSHPAFYLPAQELLAGNSRGFWVLEPCRSDGAGCETGDQCCNGFCSPNAGGMPELICSNAPPEGMCSGLQEKCTTAADCCDKSNICLNGFCVVDTPK